MKIFKKTLITLSLLLIMFITVAPVQALTLDTYTVYAYNTGLNLKFDKAQATETFKSNSRLVPVWGAVKSHYAEDGRQEQASLGAGWIKLIQELPMTWVEANPLAISDFELARWVINNDPAFANYALPSYHINHVERVSLDITVPETMVEGYEVQKINHYIANEDITDLDITKGQDITEQVVEVLTNEETKVTLATLNDADSTTVEVTIKQEDKPIELVETKLYGLLVIVEEKFVEVTINHHYILKNGESIFNETSYKQEKNTQLTKDNIKPEWVKELGTFKYDHNLTKVTPIVEDATLTLGEKFVTGYVVDLYYVTTEVTEEDAAVASDNATNQVASNSTESVASVPPAAKVQQTTNLPATGSASNSLLGSLVLILAGLFLRK